MDLSFKKRCLIVAYMHIALIMVLILLLMVAGCSAAPASILLLDTFSEVRESQGIRHTIAEVISKQSGEVGGTVGMDVELVHGESPLYPGVRSVSSSGRVTYPALGNISLEQGTVEVWVTTLPGFRGRSQYLFRLRVDQNNGLGLYYNGNERAIVAWITNDTPDKNAANNEFRTFMVSNILDWKENEQHHVCVTWSNGHQILYLDGVPVRWQEFNGEIGGTLKDRSVIEIGESTGMVINAVRVWDQPRSPRFIHGVPTVSDQEEQFLFPVRVGLEDAELGELGEEELATDLYRMRIDKESGLPASLIHRPAKVDLLFQPVRLVLSGQEVDVRAREYQKQEDALVVVQEIQQHPELKVTSRYQTFGDYVEWKVSIRNTGEEDWRGDVGVNFPAVSPDDMAFLAADDNPFPVRTGMAQYGGDRSRIQGWTGYANTYLPLSAVYHGERDYGLTVCQPPDTLGLIRFDFGSEVPLGIMGITNYDLTIKAGQEQTITYYLVLHEGDWRPVLKWMVQRFPEVFVSPHEKNPLDGPMIVGGPSDFYFLTELENFGIVYRQMGTTDGNELFFGRYVPEDPSPNVLKFYEGLSAQIESAEHHGIKGLLYINARECQSLPLAKERFADSLQYTVDGAILESYSFGAKMTCRPGSSWFNHMLQQAEALLDAVPNAHGIQFDNSWEKEYAEIIHAVSELVRSRGLVIASNGASSNSAGAVDSIMAEGTRRSLGGMQYLCLEKPMTYLPLYLNHALGLSERELAAPALIENLEQDIKGCLLAKAFYSLNYRGLRKFDNEGINLLLHYVPLREPMYGAKWYLEAHALVTPEDIDANIFQTADGGFVIYLVSWEGMPFKAEPKDPFKITANLKGFEVTRVLQRHIEDSTEVEVSFSAMGPSLEVEVNGHRSITMLRIEGNWQ